MVLDVKPCTSIFEGKSVFQSLFHRPEACVCCPPPPIESACGEKHDAGGNGDPGGPLRAAALGVAFALTAANDLPLRR